MITRKLFVAGAVALAVGLGASTSALAKWPTKPITMIVPYKAGGTTETMGQVLSKALGRELGGRVIVRTKPGGGAAVGATYAKGQKPDGHTILFTPLSALLWIPMERPEVKFNINDFQLLAGISEYQMGLVATPDKPYKTLEELIAYSKANPGLNVADMGGMSKVFLNFISKREGLNWTAIPTRGGGEMIPFILGGKVDFAYSGGIHQKYPGKMIVLASFLRGRHPLAPDAPSMGEMYDIAMPGNAIMVAPKGLPADVAATLEAAIKRSMDDPDFTKILERIQFPKRFISSGELKTFSDTTAVGLRKVLDEVRK
jgi:tripartite-type tricarboxylate transporter receptor subunit TctC